MCVPEAYWTSADTNIRGVTVKVVRAPVARISAAVAGTLHPVQRDVRLDTELPA